MKATDNRNTNGSWARASATENRRVRATDHLDIAASHTSPKLRERVSLRTVLLSCQPSEPAPSSSARFVYSKARKPSSPPLRRLCESAKLSLLLIAYGIGCISAHAITVASANGVVQVSKLAQNGTPITFGSYETELEVSVSEDGKFIVKLDSSSVMSHKPVTFAYDGETFYYISYPPTTDKSNLDATMTEGQTATAYLSGEDVPMMLFQDDARDAFWYALGSGNYLNRHGLTNEIPHLFWGPRSDVNAYGFGYLADVPSNTFAFSPSSLRIWRDKSLDKTTRSEEENRTGLDIKNIGSPMRETQWLIKEGWQDGALALELTWKDKKLFGPFLLPLEVDLVEYHPFPFPNPPRTVVKFLFPSWTVSSSPETSFVPEITGLIRVMDSRIRQRSSARFIDEINYAVTPKSGWRSIHEPEMQTEMLGAMRMKPGSSRRTILRLLFFGLILCSIVFVALRFLKKRGR